MLAHHSSLSLSPSGCQVAAALFEAQDTDGEPVLVPSGSWIYPGLIAVVGLRKREERNQAALPYCLL